MTPELKAKDTKLPNQKRYPLISTLVTSFNQKQEQ